MYSASYGNHGAVSMTPAKIKTARAAAALTQTQAGALVGAPLRTWQDWEAGKRQMPKSAWELFRIKTGQHPDFSLILHQD